MRIDLNADLGESYGAWSMGQDEALLDLVSSANLACGFHAGDPATMARTVAAALRRGVALGAHPSLPDLQGFGRRAMAITPQEAYEFTLYQIGALAAFVQVAGGRLAHVKPHGALYNMAAADPGLADGIARAVRDFDPTLCLVGLSGSALVQAGEACGLRVAREVFADRGVQPDGSLVPRGRPGALIEDEAEAVRRVLRMVQEGRVTAQGGEDIPVQADTVCLHGDQPKALAFAVRLRAALADAGVAIAPLAAR